MDLVVITVRPDVGKSSIRWNSDGSCRHLANWDGIRAAVEKDAICPKAGENRDIFLGELEVLQTRVADAEGTPPPRISYSATTGWSRQ